MNKKIKKELVNLFVFAVVFSFMTGIFVYAVSNSGILVKADAEDIEPSVSVNLSSNYEEIDPSPDHTEPYFTTEYIETFMAFPETPVEFLDEILPMATPDQNSEWYDVIEIISRGGEQFGNFFVSDTSGTNLDLASEAQKALAFDTTKTDEPMVLIYHTHSCESYMTAFNGFYYPDPDDYRNIDHDRNVAAVGEEIKKTLESYGIVTIHDTTYHDYPNYNGAYDRSRMTVEQYLEEYPSIKITIDIHRDSMTTSEGTKYKPTAVVDGRKAAQMMILAGSDTTGSMGFDTWEENLVFALKLQETASEMYPDLMRPMLFREQRYNMDLTNASLLIEVGTEANTFSEAKYSGQLLGNVIAEVIENG